MLMTMTNTVNHRHTAHIMPGNRLSLMRVLRGRHFAPGMRCLAFHGNGCERLNRKAHYQQHNDEKFAPVRHGCEV
jgi:hypothetical protein